MGCGASAASAPRSAEELPAAVPKAEEAPKTEGAEESEKLSAEEGAEGENWAWSKTVLERFIVRGADVLGVGNFSVVRQGLEISTGRAVAVKALKVTSLAKFRREVFLFEALFSDETSPSRWRYKMLGLTDMHGRNVQ